MTLQDQIKNLRTARKLWELLAAEAERSGNKLDAIGYLHKACANVEYEQELLREVG